MYEELIAVLRHRGSLPCEGCPRKTCKGAMANMREAANAIEKLVEVIQNHDFLESLMKPDWIPVTDRLPEKSGNYLTAFGDRTAMAVNEFMHPRDWLTEEGRKAHPNGKWYWGGVTHWMELPEPPKEEIVMCEDCKKEENHGRK